MGKQRRVYEIYFTELGKFGVTNERKVREGGSIIEKNYKLLYSLNV